jgi:hypothetical protein
MKRKMHRTLLILSAVGLAVGVSGCEYIGGGDSYRLPQPRQSVAEEEPPPPAAKTPPAKTSAKEKEKEKEPVPAAKAEEPIRNVPEPQRRTVAIGKLGMIGAALEGFLRQNGRYPNQREGQLSWRVAILPYLGERTLYEKFRLSEPWDSPHNRALLEPMPAVFASVERPFQHATHYLLFTGPETAWAGGVGLMPQRCPDGLENTALLGELSDALGVPWTQPEDYFFKRETAQQDLFGLRKDCCYVVFGGGFGVRRAADAGRSRALSAKADDGLPFSAAGH